MRRLAIRAASTIVRNHEIVPSLKVVIVTDAKVKQAVVTAFQQALEKRGLPETDLLPVPIIEVPPPNYSGEEPLMYKEEDKDWIKGPLPLEGYETVFFLTSLSLSHTKASKAFQESGGYVISMGGMTDYKSATDILKPVSTDPEQMEKLCAAIAKTLGEGPSEIEIESPDGRTHLTMKVPAGNWKRFVGKKVQTHRLTNGVDGEYCSAPIPGTTNGTIVITPGSCVTNLHMITEEIRLIIRDGLVTEIIGDGPQAGRLRQIVQEARDKLPDSLKEFTTQVAEISFGLNAQATTDGKIIVVEKSIKRIHCAFGSNDETLTTGYDEDNPPRNVGLHVDIALGDVTVSVDDRVIFDKGKLLVAAA